MALSFSKNCGLRTASPPSAERFPMQEKLQTTLSSFQAIKRRTGTAPMAEMARAAQTAGRVTEAPSTMLERHSLPTATFLRTWQLAATADWAAMAPAEGVPRTAGAA